MSPAPEPYPYINPKTVRLRRAVSLASALGHCSFRELVPTCVELL